MAVARAAEAMLRALGGAEISLVFPLLQMPNDPSAELGLMDPGVEGSGVVSGNARELATPGWAREEDWSLWFPQRQFRQR